MVNALRNCLSSTGYGHGPFRRVGQHLRCHLYRGAGHLPDLLDLGPRLADERAALAGRNDETQRYGRPGHPATSAVYILELGTPLRIPIAQKHDIKKCTGTH